MSRGRALAGLAALALGQAGCAPPVDPAALAAVQIGSKEEPPKDCRALGPLEGKDTNRWAPGGLSSEAAVIDLRKKAVAGGGNRVVIDEVTPPRSTDYMPAYVIQARLFICPVAGEKVAPAPSSPVASAAPAPARVCEPECSPGYTCLRGTCVSACNPLCGPGERCGADRICRSDPSVTIPAPALPAGPR